MQSLFGLLCNDNPGLGADTEVFAPLTSAGIAGAHLKDARDILAHHVSTALTGGVLSLAVAVVAVLALIVRRAPLPEVRTLETRSAGVGSAPA